MARRYRRKVRSGRRRRGFRRRTGVRKALSRVRSLSRKIAGEVKKIDVNAIIPETSFTQITNAVGTAADTATSLPDFGYLYSVFSDASSSSTDSTQGLDLGDFIGEQIRAKYLYLGLHIQMPVRPSDTTSSAASVQQPLCLRCMVVQDRNYSTRLNVNELITNLFGLQFAGSATAYTYQNQADYTLLPINPQEPGRFNVIRDFKMYVAPGYRMDYYKKLMFLQRDLLSGGRFYAGASALGNNNAPGQSGSTWSNMRNNLYVLLLYQSPTLYGANQAGSPDFTVSVQTRLAYYDN